MALNANPAPALQPSAVKVQLPTNYISLFDYTSQYAPETHDEMVDIYGSQSVNGMLHILGAEAAIASDQYIWTEKGRLHTVYKDVARAGNVFTKAGHNFRKNEMVHISDGSVKRIGVITAVPDASTFTVAAYKAAGFTALGTTNLTVFAFGSEFRKGTNGMEGSLETDFTILKNKPIIMKDMYEVSGSDATQIGWVKTSNGGYLWYMESEADMRRRWEDRLELALILGEMAEDGSDAAVAGLKGTEGAFDSVKRRGNSFQGVADTLAEWDTILKRFDAQGKIDGYMYYCDRDSSLGIDNLLGELNAGYSGGVSYGVFDNSESMAVNLGFRGFRRGSYDFYKTDWKLLNDPTLLGAVDAAAGKVRGLLVPVGTKEVYEGAGTDGGKKANPYLQIKYRASGAENRKYKTWVTGSVGGVHTNDSDKMQVHELSERGLMLAGANNFMLFEGN
jgi:hypothetical protein